jgi:hypothetical protein
MAILVTLAIAVAAQRRCRLYLFGDRPYLTLKKEQHVKPILAICVLVALSSAPALSQTPGADPLNYYVGTWACVGGPTETPAVKAAITGVMNGGLLTQHVTVPVQTGMDAALSQTFTAAYNPITKVYNQVEIDNFGGWHVSKASPWTGTTEEWADVASADGKLGRTEIVRTDKNHFTSLGYATPTDTTPNFKATCERSSM